MRKITIIAFLVVSLNAFAQDKTTDLKKITKLYTTELKLDNGQSKKIKSIFSKYQKELFNKNIKASDFNTKLKLQTLDIHKVLSKEQFEAYLKLRSKHQPELSYRFK